MADNCIIDIAAINDIEMMRELWASLPGLGLGPGDDKAAITGFMERNPHTCLVLRKNRQIIGTVLGGFDGRRGYVYHLAVRQNYQRNGYGTLLLENVVQALKHEGAGKIHLLVFRDNSAAQSFYTARGWHLREDINIFSMI
ncbi:MAG: GNAT family N-acetyltransferase [Syntrophomonadaceae bacterium]|mgnify:FL=1